MIPACIGETSRSPDLPVELHQRLEIEQALLRAATQPLDQQRKVHAEIASRCSLAARRRVQEPGEGPSLSLSDRALQLP